MRADPGLIPKMAPEIIRYQSPVVHMRRTAAAASAFVVRVRHSPLRRQPAGGDAADDPVEGNPEALPPIEVVEKPKRAYSNLIHGITEMKVRIPA